MRNRIFTSLIVFFLTHVVSVANAKCDRYVNICVYNDGIGVTSRSSWGLIDILFDAFIAPGDSVTFYASVANCMQPLVITTMYNGDTIFNSSISSNIYQFTAYDTGHYFMSYDLGVGGHINCDVTVHYNTST